jgi:alpha-L-fucosidase
MKIKIHAILSAAVSVFIIAACAGVKVDSKASLDAINAMPVKTLEENQRDFVDLRYGMFIHFGILTYTGSWSQKNLDISKFNPTELDCLQWADSAAAAGMKFGVLTTKHHDGFALWPTETSDFSVKGIPWRNGRGDVVREYVDAFRAKGLLPGLYYSVWDNTKGIGNKPVTEGDVKYVEAQLKELLTNYGPIPILVLDGWSWKMGHKAMPYDRIRAFVKSLQPNCLLVDHNHLQGFYNNDLVMFEEPKGVFSPKGNKLASGQGQKIINGNDWFWGNQTATDEPMSSDDIATGHLKPLEERYTVFILNCPPNRKGLLDGKIVDRISEAGKKWKPNINRKPLPKQPPQNELPVTPESAYATSGNAALAIDGQNDAHTYTVWESDRSFPQSVTIDLGKAYTDIGFVGYVPKYVITAKPTDEGAITSYAIYTSLDGDKFTKVSEGKWAADSSVKTAVFGPAEARYVRFEVLAAKDGYAAATEISVGQVTTKDSKLQIPGKTREEK